jgi:CBS domain containing-hemolysin-like protein
LNTLLGLLAVLLLVGANGFFVAAEFSLVSVRRSRIAQLVQEGKGSAKVVDRIVGRLDTAIAATQLGITMASLGLGWIGESTVAQIIEPLFEFLPGLLPSISAHSVGVAIGFIIITGLHIVFGELAPKSLALERTEATALTVARPLEVFETVFKPFIFALNSSGNFVVRLFGLNAASGHELVHSVEELEILIETSREAGAIEEDDAELLGRAFDFADKKAYQVMTPRTALVAIPESATFVEVKQIASTVSFSRFPAYRGDLDHIIGVLHLRDLILQNDLQDTGQVKDLIRPVMLVPDTLPLEDLLVRLRESRQQMAVLIDEFGGTAGIVSDTDIVEELVGEIRDEYDKRGESIQVVPGGALVQGQTPVEVVNERFGLSLRSDVFDTVGGFVIGELGRMAEVGDKVGFGSGRFEVIDVDGHRVSKVRLIVGNNADTG